MREQHPLVGDRDDVVVERARRDRLLGLRGEDRAPGIEAVAPRDRFRRFDMLAGRKGAARDPVDEDLNSRLSVRSPLSRM